MTYTPPQLWFMRQELRLYRALLPMVVPVIIRLIRFIQALENMRYFNSGS